MPCKDPEKQKEVQRNWVRRKRATLSSMKTDRGCDYCGYNSCAEALHWHHTSGDKEHGIAFMTNRGMAIDKILKEIDKCVLLCANCHTEEHVRLKNERIEPSG